MASTLTLVNIHYVFSTKKREKLIDESIKIRLWAYIGGIARENKMIPLVVGGTNDHVHLLITLPPTMNISKAAQLIKIGSSKWIHKEFPEHKEFAWQSGYGAFSVSFGRIPNIVNYIKNQEDHHKKKTFAEEYIEFLKLNGIVYDERFVLE